MGFEEEEEKEQQFSWVLKKLKVEDEEEEEQQISWVEEG